MAMSAYYLKGVQKTNVELMEIFRGIMPFLGIVIFAMFLMYHVSRYSFMVTRDIIC
jgi:TRAP-type mannitol/chloroaromatic compound transport system permease large subunit